MLHYLEVGLAPGICLEEVYRLSRHNWHVLCTHTYMQSHQAGMIEMCFKITFNKQLALCAYVFPQHKKKNTELFSVQMNLQPKETPPY